MLLYYITDRTQFPGDETKRRRRLLGKIGEAARAGVDYIQLREKDLSGRELEILAREAIRVIQRNPNSRNTSATRLLINSRVDIAISAGAAGVHLPSHDLKPREARMAWQVSSASTSARPVIAASCHTVDEVTRAKDEEADFVVFAPIFEKRAIPAAPAAGPETLRQACQHSIPIFALGGVSVENAGSCAIAGAAGIAGIRLFQENDVAAVVQALGR